MSDFEREDMELQALMGDKFVDSTKETNEKPAEKPVAKPISVKYSEPVKIVPAKEIPVGSQWQPVKPAPNFMDKLRNTVKDVLLYAVLSTILFWWQQTGRLEATTAWYSLLVCVGMVFFSVGKNWHGGANR